MQRLALTSVNQWNALMDQELRALRRAIATGRMLAPISDLTAVNLRASQQQPFVLQAKVTTPVPGVSDVSILDTTLEKGFAGVITGLTHGYQGPNFTDFSGNLIWELMVDYRFYPGYAQMIELFGDTSQPRQIIKGIPVGPGEEITYLVTNIVGSPIVGGAPSYAFAAVSGVKFPLK